MSNSVDSGGVPRARVLVVDDEAEIRSSVGRLLSLLGYEVDTAASGEKALEMIEGTPYDVAVLDIRMPGLDGMEVMERAAESRPAMAAILLTGYASLETAIAAVRAQAVDYLRKPAGAGDIARAIDAALQRRAHGGQASGPTQDRFLQAGPLMLDRETRLVTVTSDLTVDARCARLTKSETAVVAHLMHHPDVVVSCRDLAGALGYEVDEEEARAVVRPHISRVRKKIELDPASPRLIQTIPRQGYTLKT